jgi:hypothetical protein
MTPTMLKGGGNYRVIRHLINVGSLTAVECLMQGISPDLRSRVSELRRYGFDIESKRVEGKMYKVYFVPNDKLERNSEWFSRIFYPQKQTA